MPDDHIHELAELAGFDLEGCIVDGCKYVQPIERRPNEDKERQEKLARFYEWKVREGKA